MTVEGSSTRGRTTKYQRGTPCYRAPELFATNPNFTTKVDIFAIGCILYEFISGKKAFEGDVELLKYSAGIGNQLDFPFTRFRTATNLFLEALVRQLLSLRVEERPSAATLLRKLAAIPAGFTRPEIRSDLESRFEFDDTELSNMGCIACGGGGEVYKVTLSYL
jgi:serine/threonine protein kinase